MTEKKKRFCQIYPHNRLLTFIIFTQHTCVALTHLALDSSEDKRFHDEFSLRNTVPFKAALLLMGFL